jgi:hypothetical protein
MNDHLLTVVSLMLLSKIKFVRYAGVIITAAVLQGCGGGQSPEQTADAACQAPVGATLTDVQSVVDWINALAKPLTLPCFIESLPRPLKIQPAYSEFSAQPSPDYRSPRIFFFFDRLILTVAVDQNFSEFPYPLLEMSYVVDEETLITTKAELKFPVLNELSPAAPYTWLSFNDRISQCSFCHPRESILTRVDGEPVYQSSMLKPTTPLPVNQLYLERENCQPNEAAHRCAMLASIVDHGELLPYQFPAKAPTIFDN